MKNLIVIILIAFSFSVYGQRIQPIGPYERKMDSIAISNFSKTFLVHSESQRVLYYKPVQWVKISASRSANSSIFGKLNFNNLTSGGPFISDITANDIFGIYTYDIRLKVYISPKLSFTSRMIATGIKASAYNYSWGIKYKF